MASNEPIPSAPEALDAADVAFDALKHLKQRYGGQRRRDSHHGVEEWRLLRHVLRRCAKEPRRREHAAGERVQKLHGGFEVAQLVACQCERQYS